MNLLISLNALGFFGIAILGVFIHAVIKWARGEIPTTLFSYFFQTNTRASVLMLLGALGGTAAALLTHTIGNLHDGAHVLTAWGIGYAADSSLNKGSANE